ncbi:pilus (MSHA type) biogenesis protein MshL [Pseudoduganella lutea]|uniref:Pilus (MSHA type) biogenesis protein MshL n=1 Tax=Pseudoduganella lutea TaxID=321985 RepID=A0A4P6L6T5_9BURK|nr:pilus (MSHA type) biogenesis protein MshL [Pseudoduganella lutea]QBE66658.1 pilus (MSHA type) biogenesis protein MshL [Pseudoduganella lutea]
MHNTLKAAIVAGLSISLAACSVPRRDTYDAINAELAAVRKPQAAAPAAPQAVADALLPPASQLAGQMPKARTVLEERFNVAFNNVPAQQFFTALVTGTRYNMLVSPEVVGTISANLKDVTLFEALDAVRELYGYDYRVEGTRISIRPLTIQTRMFQVNYLTAQRMGMSNLRVSSTSVADQVNNQSNGGNGSGNGSGSGNQTGSNGNSGNNGGQGSDSQDGSGGRLRDSSSVTTVSHNDFWTDLRQSLEAIVGSKEGGRNVIITPQSGVILVRAMPEELRNVERYLKATQLAVERQVILEAKILEVQLNRNYQSGINWAAFARNANSRLSAGMLQPGTTLGRLPAGSTPGVAPPQISTTGPAGIVAQSGHALGAAAEAAGSLFGLAFQTSNFAALISFLEEQGTVHVLSSPRIATMNNQKAVLKVGTDEFFVTGVSTTTTTNSGGGGTVTPNVTLQPFFSGVVLDVTPQIDDAGNITLHVHPSVSQVSTVTKSINLGSAGSLNLPLAASVTSEMDSIVRGQDGQVVAIGGLMRQATSSDRSQVPGAGSLPVLGALFRNTADVIDKRELVVLIRPTIVDAAGGWNEDLQGVERRMRAIAPNDAFQRR